MFSFRYEEVENLQKNDSIVLYCLYSHLCLYFSECTLKEKPRRG